MLSLHPEINQLICEFSILILFHAWLLEVFYG
jgi:hypothetical protein